MFIVIHNETMLNAPLQTLYDDYVIRVLFLSVYSVYLRTLYSFFLITVAYIAIRPRVSCALAATNIILGQNVVSKMALVGYRSLAMDMAG